MGPGTTITALVSLAVLPVLANAQQAVQIVPTAVLEKAVRHYLGPILSDSHPKEVYLSILGRDPSDEVLRACTTKGLNILPVSKNQREPASAGIEILKIVEARPGRFRIQGRGVYPNREGGWASEIILLKRKGQWAVSGEAGEGVFEGKKLRTFFK